MLVYFALLTPVLLLFCGLVVDVGYLESRRLQMQSASDAAAISAELEIERGTGQWVSSAQSDASVNGFTNGTNSATVTAAMRPISGGFSGFYDAVQTTVSQPQPLNFMRIIGKSSGTITTTSVALVPPCVYLMGVDNLTTYELSTTAASIRSSTNTSSTPSCPYYIGGAASVDANSSFSALGENITGTSGGSSWNNSSYATPRYGAATMTDPLISVTQPSAGSCAATNFQPGTISSNTSYNPGTYCGTTVLTCNSPGTTLTLEPGLYVIAGTLKVNFCTLAGTGVTLFFTKYNGSYGQLVTAGAILNMTAPTSSQADGTLPGILFMSDRTWQTSNAQDFILGTTTVTSDGIWYLSGAGLAINSGYFAAPTYAGLVADNLVVFKSTFATPTNFSSLQGGNPFRPAGGIAE